jgi:HEAT repeat protein
LEKTVIKALADPDYRQRMRAIHALVDQGNMEAVPYILPLLQDREMPVRNAAIVALGMLSDRQAFEPLVGCLAASTSQERGNAVQALVQMGDSRRRDPLIAALKIERTPSVRQKIVKAISVFPDDEVIEMLIQCLMDLDEDVRATAAVALGKIGHPRAIPALEQMMLSDTNQETFIHHLWIDNSAVARQAIDMIRYPEQEHDLDWPD